MAVTATSQVLHDGNRNLVMQFTGVCDGGGDESLVTKVDLAALSPVPKSVKIMRIQGEVSGGILSLLWGGMDPQVFHKFTTSVDVDYDNISGMTNGGTGGTGDGNIVFSTEGFDIGSSYSIVLTMQKKF